MKSNDLKKNNFQFQEMTIILRDGLNSFYWTANYWAQSICDLLRKLLNLPLAFLKEIVGDTEEACDFVKRAFLEQMSSQNFQLHFNSQAKTWGLVRRCWRIPRGSEGTFGPDLLVKRGKRSIAGRKWRSAPHWAERLCWTNGRRLRGGAKMAEEAGLPEVGPRK